MLNDIKLTSRWRFVNFLSSQLSQLQSIESLTSPQVYKQDSPLAKISKDDLFKCLRMKRPVLVITIIAATNGIHERLSCM